MLVAFEGEMLTYLQLENMKGRDILEDLTVE
jgi:hypothetical protein